MRRVAPRGRPWPDRDQLLVLRAALLGDAAAWARLRARGGPARLRGPSEHLLALVAPNLDALDATPDEARLVRDLYAGTWLHNQALLHRVGPAVAALRDAGVDAMALKGAGLVARNQRAVATRWMADVDLLVRPADAERAAAALEGAGFPLRHRFGLANALATQHGAAFVRDGYELDLHWSELHVPVADPGLWERARPGRLAGVTVLRPAAADALLHAITHGFGPRPPGPRWIADAWALAHDGCDWDVLVDRAVRHDVALPVTDALRFLRDELGLAVPRRTLAALAARRPSLRRRLAHRAVTAPPAVPLAPFHVQTLDVYRRRAHAAGARPTFRGYLTYEANLAGQPTYPVLLRHWTRRALRRGLRRG